MAGFGSRFRGKCFQGKKTAVTVRCSYAAVSSHVAATATYSYNCRLFAQEVLNPSKSRQPLSTPGLFLAALSLLVRALAYVLPLKRCFYLIHIIFVARPVTSNRKKLRRKGPGLVRFGDFCRVLLYLREKDGSCTNILL